MTEDLHTLAGAYALDAIDNAEERSEFEEHLAACETCAAELREFRATSSRLGQAAAEPPPLRLRERVLADVRHVQQLPPLPPHLREDQPARPAEERPGHLTSDRPSHRTDVPFARPAEDRSTRPAKDWAGRRAGRWRRGVAAGLAAAACLVAGVSVVQVVRERQRVERAEAAYRDVASVLSAPDARTATGPVTGGGTVTVVASAARGRVVVASAGLPALPSSRAYQLWLIDADGARSAGMLPADRSRPVVAGTWRPSDRLGMTVEPTTGSARPTSEPLVLLSPA